MTINGRAPQARSFLRAKQAAREARDENVRAKRADFFLFHINLRKTILTLANNNYYHP